MKKVEQEIIMYDSLEAAHEETVTGWVSGGDDRRFWGKDEHMARWCGCTHTKCECGNITSKSYLKCDVCRRKGDTERYNALPFKEWDGKAAVVTSDGDTYFFSEDSLIDHMVENDLTEINLLICEPIYYSPIDSETVCSDAHEDWEPEKELTDAINAFNKVLETLPAHSWMPGKTRTNYKIQQ